MTSNVIPEIDVLIAVSLWLKQRKVLPYSFSVASGQGIDTSSDKRRLKETLIKAGLPEKIINFTSDGPDIIAVSQKEYWQVECKGAGSGKKSTQRNNFDRALASTVSYYCDKVPEMPDDLKSLEKATPIICLALPLTDSYLSCLQKRVQKSLRKRLNLWVLLLDNVENEIRAIAPDDDYETNDSRTNVNTNNTKTQIHKRSSGYSSMKTNSGANLNERWNVKARHALYHKDGIWYMPLDRFPGAYFDPHGYVLFETEEAYLNCPNLSIGERVNVKGGLRSVPGYIKVE